MTQTPDVPDGFAPDPSPAKPRHRRRIWRWVLLAVVVLVGGFGGHWWWIGHRANVAIAAYGVAGHPTTWRQLNDSVPRPPAQLNAAEMLRPTLDAIDQPGSQELELLFSIRDTLCEQVRRSPDKTLSAEQTAGMEKLLERMTELSEVIDGGMRKSQGARWYEDYRQAVSPDDRTMLPKLRKAAVLMQALAYYQITQPQIDQAIDSMARIMFLAGTLKNEPLQIDQIVRFSIEMIFLDTACNLLRGHTLEVRQLDRLAAIRTSNDDPTWLLRAIKGEVCAHLTTLDEMTPGSITSDLHERNMYEPDERKIPLPSPWYFLTNGPRREIPALLKSVTRIESLGPARQPGWWERQVELRETLRREMASSYYCGQFWLDDLRILSLDAKRQASVRTFAAVLAIERYRITEGRLPGSLHDLVPEYLPEVPLDPFDDQPLRYLPLSPGPGYMVYSVGEDLKDEHGALDKDGDPIDRGIVIQR
ncbi:MAG: hypothetical protein IT442_12860 [Phycisphaeraceae bacterium]|nr:hypothetical protein [Phycisphaeraceae bacterium]